MTAIQAHQLSRRFGPVAAVEDVSLEVAEGSVFGLVGPDGAGKSTLIRMLATVLKSTSGDALIFGESVTKRPERVRQRLGYMSQQFSMYPDLSIGENLEFFATLRDVPKARIRPKIAELTEAMGLANFLDRRAGKLSGGMKQKLMLSATLINAPGLILLDEPTTGVDPASRREFWRILRDVNADGTTVVVATPYMDEAELCTDLAFQSGGRIIRRGTPDSIRASVPGVLVEVSGADPHWLLPQLSLPGAHIMGDSIRVLAGSLDQVQQDLAARNIAGVTAKEIPMDMESAYAYLNEART